MTNAPPENGGPIGRGGRKATINDIARMAGVSKKTVSRVINDSPFVQKETRDRIKAIMAETDYTPDPQARGLAFRRSFLIGLVYDNPNSQYIVNMQLGLLDALRGSGFELVVHPCDRTSPTYLADLRDFVERQKLFGVVLTPSASEDDRLARILDEIGCEYVRIASVELDVPKHMLVSHDRIGGEQAARCLVNLGHREIALITGPVSFRSSHERRAGFVAALSEAGIALPPKRIYEGAYTFESGIEGASALLALKPRPTAIFAQNDEMAAGVLQAARQAGLSVPEDLSIVGYDDFKIALVVWPQLTTIHTPTREIGRLAGDKVMAKDDSTLEADPARLPSLIVRGSTAPPKA